MSADKLELTATVSAKYLRKYDSSSNFIVMTAEFCASLEETENIVKKTFIGKDSADSEEIIAIKNEIVQKLRNPLMVCAEHFRKSQGLNPAERIELCEAFKNLMFMAHHNIADTADYRRIFVIIMSANEAIIGLCGQLKDAKQRVANIQHIGHRIGEHGDVKGVVIGGRDVQHVNVADNITTYNAHTVVTMVSVVGVLFFFVGGYVGSVKPTLFKNLFGIKSIFGFK